VTPAAVYTYYDAVGRMLRRKLRFEFVDASGARAKTFAWQTYDPSSDTWTLGARDATSTLYNLHLIASARPAVLYVVEGEKNADDVTALGLVGVTSGNARSWRRHHSEQLRACGCGVCIILPDADDPGERHAFDVAHQNLVAGIRTKIVRLPNLAAHEDVSDFLDRGGDREDLVGYAKLAKYITLADLPANEDARARTFSKGARQHRQHDPRLIELYREKLKLPRTARGRMMVVCPFHVDADPSLSLDLDRLIWYCHGCQTGGGPAEFYMQWQKLHGGRTMTRGFVWQRLSATYL
jgi:hypothetical protein